jgi:hypothetical protein
MSWISLILLPAFPITEPIREFGTINRIVTAREPGTEGTSNGSSLIRRTINPNAFETASNGPATLKIRSAFPGTASEIVALAPDFSRTSLI